jgi:hypothetical protein
MNHSRLNLNLAPREEIKIAITIKIKRGRPGFMVAIPPRNRRCPLSMNLGIHEAQRAGSSLAQAGGLGMDGMECRRPVGPRLLFNFSCISPALQAGGIFVCRFPGRCPGLRHRAPLALIPVFDYDHAS